MLILSISLASALAIAQAKEFFLIKFANSRRFLWVSFLESVSPSKGLLASRITIAATTGPTMQPLPTSSIPATIFIARFPASHYAKNSPYLIALYSRQQDLPFPLSHLQDVNYSYIKIQEVSN